MKCGRAGRWEGQGRKASPLLSQLLPQAASMPVRGLGRRSTRPLPQNDGVGRLHPWSGSVLESLPGGVCRARN